jgi:flagellar biosynthesis chaperone FliJ
MFRNLIARIREGRSERRAARALTRVREEEVLAAIEHVVDEINPKLRAVSSYRKKLRQAVERALAYSAEIVAAVPGPVEVNKTVWNSDPMVRAFFTGVEDMRHVLSRSNEVHDYFDSNDSSGQQYCYALLNMQRSERTVLGVENRGDIIRRDVKQTSVSFKDRRVVKPGPSESQLRQDLEKRAFEVLVAYVLERITRLIVDKHSLKEKQLLLDMQLRLAKVKKAGLSPLLGDREAGVEDVEALEQQQQHMAQESEQADTKLTTLDDYIDRITEVLGNPERYFRVDHVRMRLSQMNIRLDEKSGDGQELELAEGLLGEALRRILLIIRFPRDELLERKGF